jgi:hypothetical protein
VFLNLTSKLVLLIGFLVGAVTDVLRGLDKFGFVAVSVTCDGAGEMRCTYKRHDKRI